MPATRTCYMRPSAVVVCLNFLLLPYFCQGTYVLEAISGDDKLRTLRNAIATTGLESTLKGSKTRYQIYAPTDEAFRDLPPQYFEPEYTAHLRNFLEFHMEEVSPANHDGGSLAPKNRPTSKIMSNHEEAIFHATESQQKLGPSANGGMAELSTPTNTDNGSVQRMDAFLTPTFLRSSLSEIVSAHGFSKFSEYMQRASTMKEKTNDAFTIILAPSNRAMQAFETEYAHLRSNPAALQDIFRLHVQRGVNSLEQALQQAPRAQAATTTVGTSYLARNGVVYEVDTVLVPQKYLAAAEAIESAMHTKQTAVRFVPLVLGFALLASRIFTVQRTSSLGR